MNDNYLNIFQLTLTHFYNFRLLKIIPTKLPQIREIISNICFLNLFSHLDPPFQLNIKFYHLIKKYDLKLTLGLIFTIIKSNKIFFASYFGSFERKHVKRLENYYKLIGNNIKLIRNGQYDNDSIFHDLLKFQSIYDFSEFYEITKLSCYERRKFFLQSNNGSNEFLLTFCCCIDMKMLKNNSNTGNGGSILQLADEFNEENFDAMVCCDGCNQWNHFTCIGIRTIGQRKQLDHLNNFYCIVCSEERGIEYPFIWPKKKTKRNKREKNIMNDERICCEENTEIDKIIDEDQQIKKQKIVSSENIELDKTDMILNNEPRIENI